METGLLRSHMRRFPPAPSTTPRGSLPLPLRTQSLTPLATCTAPMRGFTYVFFNVLGLHSLVGIIRRIKGAEDEPGEVRQEKGEM